jgi:hypothetical protein
VQGGASTAKGFAMPHYVGLDASKATTSICVINERAEIVREGVVETQPRSIVDFLRGDRLGYRRVGIEAMSFNPWLYEGCPAPGCQSFVSRRAGAGAGWRRSAGQT